MKGEKNLYKSFDKLAGLEDKQLATPKHDELVLFLLNEDNLIKLIPEIVEWLSAIRKVVKKGVYDYIDGIKRIEADEYNGRDDIDRLNRYTALAQTPVPNLNILSEVPILDHNNFIIGYWDIVVEFYRKNYNFNFKGYEDLFYGERVPRRIYIEVKPDVKSFGETLRQLNTYKCQEGIINNTVYLFTPDLRFKEAFESQGINVISPPKKNK